MANTCPSLFENNDDDFIVFRNSSQAYIGCRKFARRLTSGISEKNVTCNNANWVPNVTAATYKCEWNGDLNTYEKLIIGLSAAAAGALLFGIILICCLAYCYRDERDVNGSESYPPSGYNEKVNYTQYGNGGGGGGISGPRPSGKYEKHIPADSYLDSRADYIRSDTGKRDPILWSGYSSNQPREPERIGDQSGFQFYSGKKSPSTQYENKAFDRNEDYRGSGYRDTGYHGTNYPQGKREDYRWNGQLPRAHVPRDDRYDRQY